MGVLLAWGMAAVRWVLPGLAVAGLVKDDVPQSVTNVGTEAAREAIEELGRQAVVMAVGAACLGGLAVKLWSKR